MPALALAAGIVLGFVVLWDSFETILLPRRASNPLRITRAVLESIWRVWSAASRPIRDRSRRENFLSFYAILSLLFLFAVWAFALITAFALAHWSIGRRASVLVSFGDALYLSASTFFTLGLGDVVPRGGWARTITVIEAGMGFGFLALVISYLPVLYQAFSRREVRITTLDEWSGSPPSAAALLRRNAEGQDPRAIATLLRDWEVAAAELLESHISYPILAFFRSQHDNQSWIASLTTILDTCALILVGVEGVPEFQARLTFAIGRHAAVDLSQILGLEPEPPPQDRLGGEDLARLRAWLAQGGVVLAEGPEAERHLTELRAMYEPYVHVLARYLLMPLPTWVPPEGPRFNWRTTAWARTARRDAH
ncbi:MAG TPA: potassium channel family protein [Terriglobales bacterium]|nr:potassium channel family protein [Terriglobales bacterium]